VHHSRAQNEIATDSMALEEEERGWFHVISLWSVVEVLQTTDNWWWEKDYFPVACCYFTIPRSRMQFHKFAGTYPPSRSAKSPRPSWHPSPRLALHLPASGWATRKIRKPVPAGAERPTEGKPPYARLTADPCSLEPIRHREQSGSTGEGCRASSPGVYSMPWKQ